MQFKVINILDAVGHMPDDALMQLLGSFSCTKNKQMEHFLQANAVSCAKQRFAITYLVLNRNNELCGFFTLTHKPVFFDKERIDGKRKRRVRQFCVRSLSGEQQENDEQLLASAFLIAQLAKSSSEMTGEKATGGELMSFALQTLEEIQKSIGGGLVFLECEDEEKLLAFYERQGFCKFGERDSRSYDGQFYHQLLRVLWTDSSVTFDTDLEDGQNLMRARVQVQLCRSIEANEPKIRRMLATLWLGTTNSTKEHENFLRESTENTE